MTENKFVDFWIAEGVKYVPFLFTSKSMVCNLVNTFQGNTKDLNYAIQSYISMSASVHM